MTIKAYGGVEIEHVVKAAKAVVGGAAHPNDACAAATLLVMLDVRRLLDRLDSKVERQFERQSEVYQILDALKERYGL